MASPRDGERSQLPLFSGADAPPPDQSARDYATDPRNDVVLEASAGTGKTSVLVRRYLALLDLDVDPANILAMTFTRKAAAEMRERIVTELRRRADQSAEGRRRWRQLRDRLSDVAISTIDAFCLSLLGEFPLVAGLDPGFGVADETELAALLETTLDRALRIARARAGDNDGLRMLLAQVPQRRLSRSLGRLVDRRVVAASALRRVLERGPAPVTLDAAVREAASRVAHAVTGAPGGVLAFTEDRPAASSRHDLLRADLEMLLLGESDALALRVALEHLRDYFVGQSGRPRTRPRESRRDDFPSRAAWQRHKNALRHAAPAVVAALADLDRQTNLALVSGVRHLHGLAVTLYRRGLDERDLVDFTEALERTVGLLANMDEFAQSRYRLQSRYHHVLVDEMQDTSRLQWRLVSLLVDAWGEGYGLVHEAPLPPSIFVVGDRKQSIYRFRDADVTILEDAGRFVSGLRQGSRPRRSISRSFRSRPALLAFVNDLCAATASAIPRRDAFRYGPDDRFPTDAPAVPAVPSGEPELGLILTDTDAAAARAVAGEVCRLLAGADVRDRESGVARRIRPGDIAILFRSRESHRAFEEALDARHVPTYVYKGLGFFEADEVADLGALIRYLARPASHLRAAAFLRSRLVRLSDPGLLALGRDLVDALLGPGTETLPGRLGEEDQAVLGLLRRALPRWLSQVDRVPPAQLIDDILRETAYDFELRGTGAAQAHENVKKLRMLVRRLQNRGYLTMARLAEHLDRLSTGDESNAVVDAADAVNLMTVHAAKGLEFPVVFVVNLGRGTGGGGDSIRVLPDDGTGEPAVAVAGFRSEAEEHDRDAEREESKRLLYVALTRARDRLVLATTMTHGRFRPAPGSLGKVLPSAFVSFLEQAAPVADGSDVTWCPAGGGTHRFRTRSAARDAFPEPGTGDVGAEDAARASVDAGLAEVPADRVAVTIDARTWALRVARPAESPVAGPQVDAGREVVGRLVHRLFQARLPGEADLPSTREVAARLLRRDERAIPDLEGTVAAAASIYLSTRQLDDVSRLLATGDAHYEVPFTLCLSAEAWRSRAPLFPDASAVAQGTPVLVRGIIDCIVLEEPRRATVLEIKTGRRAAWHDEQLAVYVEAARHLWPDRAVDGRIVYAGEAGGRER